MSNSNSTAPIQLNWLRYEPLTGFAAFQKCIERIYPNSGTAWFKFGHDQFFRAETNPSGRFELWATKGRDTDRKKTECFADTFSSLTKLSRSQPGGCFYIPGKPTDFPLKDYCTASADIGAEMDDGTTQEQWEQIEWLNAVTGLEPGLVIGSGGKSLHLHLFLNADILIAQATHLKKLLAIALLSDPAVVNPHQPMRIAGFTRLEKGKEQTLEFWSDHSYSLEEFTQGLRAAFKAIGYIFPEQLSDERWRRIRKALTTKGLAPDSKISQIKEILALDEAALYPKPQQYERSQDFKYNGDHIPLEVCLTKDDRELIARGVGEGSRGLSAFKLAVNLIATASHLDAKRISYGEDPRLLFDDFCARCSPPLSSPESEAIWRSASRGSATPSLTDEAIENCVAAWQYKQNPYGPKRGHSTIDRDVWKARFGFPDWLKGKFPVIPKPFKGFGKRPQSKKTLTQSIKYIPGELPTLTEYMGMGSPKIIFAPGQRLQLLQEAVEKEYHDILDSSAPGTYKTSDAGIAIPDAFGVKKLWYFTQQSRNPATSSIEQNFTPLPVRNDGFIADSDRKTPSGAAHLRWPQGTEKPDTTGNCFRTKEFRALAAKNVPNIEGSMNPVCGNCHLLGACQQGSATGASFRGKRREALAYDRIAANLASAPLPAEFKDYASSGGFIDEALQNLNPMRSLTIDWADYSQSMDSLEQALPSVHAALKPLRDVLSPALRRQVREPYYGFNDSDVVEMLGAMGAIAEVIPQVIDWENNLSDLNFLEEELDGVANIKSIDKGLRSAAKFASNALRRESYKDKSTQLDNVAVRWLASFLQIWQRTDDDWKFGSFRIKNGELTLYWRDRRHSDLAKAMKWVCYQDATATRPQLALVQDIDSKTILHIQHKPPDYSNLRIIQVAGLGLLGKQRSDSADRKVESVKRALAEKHLGIGLIDWKSSKPSEFKHGVWFGDSRSTNRYADAPALASFGVPFIKLGELQALYQTLTGRSVSLDKDNLDEQFQEFVDLHVQSEIIQTAGRTRSHLRPDEQIPYYFIGNYDLDFLKEAFPGAIVEPLKASDITLDVCDTMERNLLGILRGLSANAAQGVKQTQAAISQVGNLTQGQVSKILAQVGGLDRVQKLFQTLYTSPIAFGIISELPPDEQFLAREFLRLALEEYQDTGEPEQLVVEVVQIIRSCGWESWRRMISSLSGEVHVTLLAQIVRLFPDEWQSQLATFVEGGEEWSLT